MCRIASPFLLQRLKGSMSGDARDFNNSEIIIIIIIVIVLSSLCACFLCHFYCVYFVPVF
jgi:hypothetical protein